MDSGAWTRLNFLFGWDTSCVQPKQNKRLLFSCFGIQNDNCYREEAAAVQVEGRASGKELCREGPGGPGSSQLTKSQPQGGQKANGTPGCIAQSAASRVGRRCSPLLCNRGAQLELWVRRRGPGSVW